MNASSEDIDYTSQRGEVGSTDEKGVAKLSLAIRRSAVASLAELLSSLLL